MAVGVPYSSYQLRTASPERMMVMMIMTMMIVMMIMTMTMMMVMMTTTIMMTALAIKLTTV